MRCLRDGFVCGTFHRTHLFVIHAAATYAWSVLLLFCAAVVAQEKPEKPAAENSELSNLLESARRYELRLPKSDSPLKLHEPSLLNFTNPQRNQELGSVFVWMNKDRPAVMGQ